MDYKARKPTVKTMSLSGSTLAPGGLDLVCLTCMYLHEQLGITNPTPRSESDSVGCADRTATEGANPRLDDDIGRTDGGAKNMIPKTPRLNGEGATGRQGQI